MSQSSQLALFGTAAALLVAVSGAQAQSVIRFTNANNHEIPLAAGSAVNIDANGNLSAECALTSGICTQLSNGGGNTNPGAVPTATLTRSAAEIIAGSSVTLSWASSGAVVCHATGSGAATTSWPGPKATASNGLGVILSAAGDYLFNLLCFNAAGASTVQTVGVKANPPPVVTDGCNITSTDPAFQPSGRTRTNKTWVQAWSAPNGTNNATYPDSIGPAVPVGAEKGGYTTIAFVPNADEDVGIYFESVQASPTIGYLQARPADGMMLALSPCAGDVRGAASANDADPFLRPGCRRFANGGQLTFTTRTNVASDFFVCRLQAGQTYYLNVMAANPADGLSNSEHTCLISTDSGCDVQAQHRKQ
jgi:hypothetical protein